MKPYFIYFFFMYKTQVHIYWKLNERYLIGKRYTVLKVLETPCLRPSSSQLCPSQAERWWVLGQWHHFRFHVWSYFQHVILLPFSWLRGCKLCSAHVLKQCLYNKHSRPTRTAFIHQLDSFTSEILTLCPAPPTHKAGRILLAQGKGCPFSQGRGPEDPEEPPTGKAWREWRKFITHGPPHNEGRESGSWGRAPCYCPSP